MVSHLTILCPDLIKNMEIPIIKMGLPELLQLKEAYLTQFAPWWSEWNKLVNHIDEKAILSSEQDKAKLEEELQKHQIATSLDVKNNEPNINLH